MQRPTKVTLYIEPITQQWFSTHLLLLLYVINKVFSQGMQSEYCLAESFNVSCPNDQVLLVRSAAYGRMSSSSKCISSSYGHIGCSADVGNFVRDECSARQRCEMPVAKLLKIATPCPSDVTSYLQVDHHCVAVAGHRCEDSGYQSLSSDGGYFILSPQSHHISGTVHCPWRLKLGPYQRADFYLRVYGSNVKTAQACALTMIFEEDSNVSEKRLCKAEPTKDVLLFKSLGHEIRMYIINEENLLDDQRRFLINYSVHGCPVLIPPRHSWIMKQDQTSATVRCNRTEETWFLACDGRQWKGEIGNCSSTTDVAALGGDVDQSKTTPFPYGFVVAVVIGVLLRIIIGALPLFVVYYCLKRKWRLQAKHDNDYYGETLRYVDERNRTLLKCNYDSPDNIRATNYCSRGVCSIPQCSFGTYSTSSGHQQGEGYFIDGMQMMVAKQTPSKQPPSTDCGDCKFDVDVIANVNCCQGCKGRGTEHVYESASCTRKPKIPFETSTGNILPGYFSVEKPAEEKAGVTDGVTRKLLS